jgi:DNA-binding MarR family transcriptional regulator
VKRLVLIPALHRATHRVGLHLQERGPGVTQGEAHLLAHLHESDGESSVAGLHRAWGHKRSTLTDIVDRLEKQGLARRSVAAEDRRSVLVHLTAKGRRVAAAAHRELAALERDVLARVDSGARLGFDALTAAFESASSGKAAPPSRRRRGR